MFNSKVLPHRVFQLVERKNSYNEKVAYYQAIGFVDMFISLNSRSEYNGNDSHIMNCQYVAFAKSPVEIKSAIDAKYIVEYVQPCRNGYYLFLSSIKQVNTYITGANSFTLGYSTMGEDQI